MPKPIVLPVIHYLDGETAVEQADLAFACGADGVFLISHEGEDDALAMPALAIKGAHPDKLVGLNLLESPTLTALRQVVELGLDMVWADASGVTSAKVTAEAREVSLLLPTLPKAPLLFGCVAFKYQAEDRDPPAAAVAARDLGMIPTTSGAGTGSAPSVDKIRSMREALGPDAPFAVASGMTPENVADFAPYLTHILVATGVSRDEHHLDADKLRRFIQTVKG